MLVRWFVWSMRDDLTAVNSSSGIFPDSGDLSATDFLKYCYTDLLFIFVSCITFLFLNFLVDILPASTSLVSNYFLLFWPDSIWEMVLNNSVVCNLLYYVKTFLFPRIISFHFYVQYLSSILVVWNSSLFRVDLLAIFI